MPVDPNAQPDRRHRGPNHGWPDVESRAELAFLPLRQPIFRAVWFASLSSNFGGLIQAVGASWLMTSIAASSDMVALVQASTTLPVMLFSLAAGAVSDNYDRRRLLLIAQGFMLTVSVMLAVFAWFG
jgi:MFS family permease